jgi:small subunit ribosomal protein S1
MSYGAFVKLEDGVEGLVHISEMSWTRRINHPSEMVKAADRVEVVVLEYNKEKQEISLGMKQAETNPWDLVEEHYPVGTIIEGTVRNLTSYGAFVEIEEGIDGLLHVTDMSWTKKITHPSEMVKKGDRMRCVVLSVDTQKKRIALGYKQLSPDPWMDHIPNNYHIGDLISGHVTKITNFGAFVRLEDDLEGLLHVSELADHKVATPEEVVQPGMKIEVRVIRVDTEERKIGLSFVHSDFEENKNLEPPAEEGAAEEGSSDSGEAPAAAAAEDPGGEAATEAETEPAGAEQASGGEDATQG